MGELAGFETSIARMERGLRDPDTVLRTVAVDRKAAPARRASALASAGG